MFNHDSPQNDHEHRSTEYNKKRIIICCDGTWQASDRGNATNPSNVARLARMLAREDKEAGHVPQVIYYQGGVASNGSGTLISGSMPYLPIPELTSFIAGVGAAGFGWGLDENVIECYHFLSNNYNPGDEIFMFGFSRGAYTARALAGVVTTMGLLRPECLSDFQYGYDLYRQYGTSKHEERLTDVTFWDWAQDSKASEDVNRLQSGMQEVTIKAIGVWDTVGALGLPKSMVTTLFPKINERFEFHDTALNYRIENAFQALALDEHRGAFTPTLWYLDPRYLKPHDCTHCPRSDSPDPLQHKIVPNLKQCWFPGYHESVGGGNTLLNVWQPDTSDSDDIALAWMCDNLDGLLAFDAAACTRILIAPPLPALPLAHPPASPYKRRRRPAADTHLLRATWAEGHNVDAGALFACFFGLDVAGRSSPRTPGRYYAPGAATNETVHPSVRHRVDAFRNALLLPYRPPALRGWAWREQRRASTGAPDGRGAEWRSRPEEEAKAAGGWLWGHGVEEERREEVVLREWVIREMEGRANFEARLLPWLVKEQLWERNRLVVAVEAEGGGARRGGDGGGRADAAFWTRTNWRGRKVMDGAFRPSRASGAAGGAGGGRKKHTPRVDSADLDVSAPGPGPGPVRTNGRPLDRPVDHPV
ncbi:Cysteine synthase a [Neofusicoccum parvum]|nr:Cysteine synthase a [Neofusicoccum parvum]